jgi:hypothetical protein
VAADLIDRWRVNVGTTAVALLPSIQAVAGRLVAG